MWSFKKWIGWRDLQRIRQITGVLVRHGFQDVAQRLKILPFLQRVSLFFRRNQDMFLNVPVEERFRSALEELGPAFVKFGQMLASRPDLIPMGFAKELRKLQDEVQPIHYELAREVVESELKTPISVHFQRFDPVPIAAASIAQVHTACLHSGEEVVVKIQRPGLESLIFSDTRILATIARLLETRIAELRPFRPQAIVQEFRDSLASEVDFHQELQNMHRFAAHMKDEVGVYVPKTFPALCTKRVLVMERIEGVKITDGPGMESFGVDSLQIVERGMRLVLRSIFEFGFFHADPHPGNFFIRRDNSIVMIDFGMMGTVESRRIDELLGFMIAILSGDHEQLIQLLLEADLISDETDMRPMGLEMGKILGRYQHLSLKEIDVGKLMGETLQIASRHHVVLPTDLVLAGKAIGIMEGIAKEVAPDFLPLESMRPYLTDLYVKRVLDPKKHTQNLLHLFTEGLAMMKDAPLDIRRVLRKVRRGELTVSVKSVGFHGEVAGRSRRLNKMILAIFCPLFFFGGAFLFRLDSLLQKGLGVLSFFLSLLFLGALTISMLKQDEQ